MPHIYYGVETCSLRRIFHAPFPFIDAGMIEQTMPEYCIMLYYLFIACGIIFLFAVNYLRELWAKTLARENNQQFYWHI